mgnify:FL=1
MKKMPLKLQNTKSHKKKIFSILFLVKFSVLVFWWQKKTFLDWTQK